MTLVNSVNARYKFQCLNGDLVNSYIVSLRQMSSAVKQTV